VCLDAQVDGNKKGKYVILVCEFIPYNVLQVGGSHGGGLGMLNLSACTQLDGACSRDYGWVHESGRVHGKAGNVNTG